MQDAYDLRIQTLTAALSQTKSSVLQQELQEAIRMTQTTIQQIPRLLHATQNFQVKALIYQEQMQKDNKKTIADISKSPNIKQARVEGIMLIDQRNEQFQYQAKIVTRLVPSLLTYLQHNIYPLQNNGNTNAIKETLAFTIGLSPLGPLSSALSAIDKILNYETHAVSKTNEYLNALEHYIKQSDTWLTAVDEVIVLIEDA